MTSRELRKKYIKFFIKKGHVEIPSASLIPENDPSALFISAGMHPLVPYLLGEPHPAGRRLVNVQKCIRFTDIEEIGDTYHHTFIEMLGNWSLGDPKANDGIGLGYSKSEAIRWSFEFLTDEKWLGLDPSRLYFTVFAGDENVPRDEEAVEIWRKLGIARNHIFYLPKSENFWDLGGGTGPCGPSSEIYYDLDPKRRKCSSNCDPSCDCGKYLEIWNNVFMEYEKIDEGTRILALRHAGTDLNFENKIPGRKDTSLNDKGRENSKKIAGTIAEFAPEIIITSPLKRAKETAELVSPNGVAILEDELLIERSMGKIEGMRREDAEKKFKNLPSIKRRGIIYWTNPPEGEELRETFERAKEIVGKIKKKYRGKKVLIVSHGDLLDSLHAYFNGLAPEKTLATYYENLSSNIYEVYDYKKLKQKNIDTGMGMERIFAVLNGLDDNYKTDLFLPIISKIEELCGKKYGENKEDTFAFRVIADHIRAASFVLGDEHGVVPSNVEQGYILRRLIRRAVRFAKKLGIREGENFTKKIAEVVVSEYKDIYSELEKNQDRVFEELEKEENKFGKTLEKGLKEFKKLSDGGISGKEAFYLFSTYGFPFGITRELAAEQNIKIDEVEFGREFEKHQNLSRKGALKKFKGGLGERSLATTNLHTATHLLHAALRDVLGKHVEQKGSNITAERLRFDFSYSEKLTDEQKKLIEGLVNGQIEKDLPVKMEVVSLDEAKKNGAIGLFEQKYGDKVKVFTIGNFSKEICGGPHAKRTGELGKFKIKKEESSSAGVRRIKAVLSN
ncbi:MAG: hypothetical protein ACD_63C00257G0002 [uncultured bacterium]|nr:MAG: hypothetical protein ACD_63C00257G0002 [uncultured bacterium]